MDFSAKLNHDELNLLQERGPKGDAGEQQGVSQIGGHEEGGGGKCLFCKKLSVCEIIEHGGYYVCCLYVIRAFIS